MPFTQFLQNLPIEYFEYFKSNVFDLHLIIWIKSVTTFRIELEMIFFQNNAMKKVLFRILTRILQHKKAPLQKQFTICIP